MKVRWRRIGLGFIAALVLVAATVVVLWRNGYVDRWARDEVIQQVEKATGGRVDLGSLRIQLSPFLVELDQFTIHGHETSSEPPFVHIDRIKVGVDLRALITGKVILGEVAVERPAVYVHIDKQGHSNVPAPPHRASSKPWNERLFSISIDRLHLENGTIIFNDRRFPVTADGGRFTFQMDYSAPRPGHDFYHGQVGWKDMRVAARNWVPFPSTWSAKFTIGRQGGSLDQFQLELPHTRIEARADWPDWARRQMEAHYRLQLNLNDIRTLMRKPHAPLGTIETTGDFRYAPGAWNLHGYYSARGIAIGFQWFHAKGMNSRGTILADENGLEIPDFQAWALGGQVGGRVRMNIHTLEFTANTRARKISLAQLFAALQNRDFPIQTFHWEANMDVDSVTTWDADFRDFASRGKTQWTPPSVTPSGEIPASAQIQYNYQMAFDSVTAEGTIDTPNTHVNLKGTIGGHNSNMNTDVVANDLRDWDELIDNLRGPNSKPVAITGRATWRGNLSGPITRPLFSGVAHAWDANYGRLHWDEVQGGLTYSPDGLTLTDMRARRGSSLAIISLHLNFTNWDFRPENEWTFRAQLQHADTADLQALAGTNYPARGQLSGQFVGGGTASQPEISGQFQLDDFKTHNLTFPKINGRLEVDSSVVRLSGVTARFGSGALGGQLTYERPSGQVQFDLFGRSLALDEIRQIQTPSLPLAGRLDFRLTGSGLPRSPQGQGTVRISSLRAGSELIGDLTGHVTSDGKAMRVALVTSLPKGKLTGEVGLSLEDSYPIQGQLTAQGIDLDPFIKAGLHLKALTSHSQVDGHFQLEGQLLKPDTIAVDANVSRVIFAFENVTLENVGPIRLVYRKSDVRVEQAELKGPDSNFQLSGVVRFNRDEPLELRVLGAINLKLIEGFVPGLQSQGAAQVDALIEGTFAQPRISGRTRLENAALTYTDFPIGLSNVNGELIFSSDHVSFSNVKAEAGGGNLLFAGTVTFVGPPQRVRYDLNIRATQVRVRWPAGMSWLLNANARMVGNTEAATLGGNITLNRLLLASGPDAAAALLMAPQGPAVESEISSPFLRNLQLDFVVNSGAGSQIVWPDARIESDASVRVRGTWSRPSVLGHVHLLSGEVNFRGNRYRLNRGDMNFANPLQLDPVLNIEAVTTIQQYEITVDLTGRASALRLSYHSDPPLPETDVISLLALGYTGQESELRTTGTAGQFGATALLSQAVSSEVGGRVARLFGISRFSVEPFQAGTGTEPNAAARISIQQQLTPNLTVTYATNATSNSQQVIQIEYAVTRDISIVALRDINGTFGIDIEFKKRFK
ncbi:MAG: translocation/assembly module TamB domain-containing protein [Acidobacteriota bacterium]|nr:translocation/assembly module TamB domain-containing protein [Acidobacteriota bacterium]